MPISSLVTFGYDAFFEDACAALQRPDLEPARVVRADRGVLRVQTATGLLAVQIAGRARDAPEAAELPVVGDWVAIAREKSGTGAVIHATLPRRSRICRQVAGKECVEQVIAANVDTMFILCGLDHDFNPRRIERYLLLARAGGVTPVVVLNKVDLSSDPEANTRDAGSVAPGIDVVAIGALDGLDVERLDRWLSSGRTVAMLGSSGAGKSTLLNRLLGQTRARTGAVRDSDGRGQHTTSHRELFVLPGGAMLVDTPGMRELQLWADDDDLAGTFADLERIAGDCRYRDCVHQGEPGCAVRKAVAEGKLEAGRLASWARLRNELSSLELRRDERAAREVSRTAGRLYKGIKRSKREGRE